jgi:hypothetical protein
MVDSRYNRCPATIFDKRCRYNWLTEAIGSYYNWLASGVIGLIIVMFVTFVLQRFHFLYYLLFHESNEMLIWPKNRCI